MSQKRCIDLRSDTVTQPTEEMRRAMLTAELGDDVYGDDPTVNRLEAMAASVMGKEAALFVASGTMGNQVSIMAHTAYGNEIIAGASSHIVCAECGAPARLSGVNFALADHPDTMVYGSDIRRLFRPTDLHYPKTSLVCLENALCNGDVVPLDVVEDACAAAHELGVPVHMDGARIFNAALALECEAKDIVRHCDSVSFCISKGLCAPVGALICGSQAFIDRARQMRKIVGGGMRQAGVVAACGIVALTTMTERLHEDHENARYLGGQLAKLPGIIVDTDRIKIDMVFWKPSQTNFSQENFIAFMETGGVRVLGLIGDQYRYVTHNGITRADIDYTVELMRRYLMSIV